MRQVWDHTINLILVPKSLKQTEVGYLMPTEIKRVEKCESSCDLDDQLVSSTHVTLMNVKVFSFAQAVIIFENYRMRGRIQSHTVYADSFAARGLRSMSSRVKPRSMPAASIR